MELESGSGIVFIAVVLLVIFYFCYYNHRRRQILRAAAVNYENNLRRHSSVFSIEGGVTNGRTRRDLQEIQMAEVQLRTPTSIFVVVAPPRYQDLPPSYEEVFNNNLNSGNASSNISTGPNESQHHVQTTSHPL